MSINSQYFIMPPLQMVLHDILDGSLLAGGVVTFYKDNARTDKKNVFQITGSPPDYTYLPLSNPMILSGIGSFVDGFGNNIIPLLYPFDADGNVELYYITVVSADGRQQYEIQGWPMIMVSPSQTTAIENYVPNGQFLLHNYISEDGTLTDAGVIDVAYGGWTVERPNGTVAQDEVIFSRYGSYTTNPTASPRYAMQFISVVPNPGDGYKNICLTYNDVNKFASDTDVWTFSFFAQSQSSSFQAAIQVKKFYGTGGDAPTYQALQTILITSDGEQFSIPITFGDNSGKVIGPNDDDYVQIIISFPTGYSFNLYRLTDVGLFFGQINVLAYPVETIQQVISKSLGGFFDIPKYNGFNLYLPPILTPKGLSFDDSEVGMVKASYPDGLPISYLPCDGLQTYETEKYSDDGIPYARLQNKLWNAIAQAPKAGTGLTYMTAAYANTALATTAQLIVSNNIFGVATSATDGAIPTGFTISNVHDGAASNYNVNAFIYPQGTLAAPTYNTIDIESLYTGNGSYNANTSGFTLGTLSGHNGSSGDLLEFYVQVSFTAVTDLAGKYFSFSVMNSSNISTPYYTWFTVDGTGTDPHHTGTGILVRLISTIDTTADIVALKIQQALSGAQNTAITTVAASSIIAGSYLNIYSTVQQFYVWYTKGGVGIDPEVTSALGIKVNLVGTETALQVASLTQAAINMKYFATPDLRGLILRGTGGSLNNWDINAWQRYSYIPGIYGDTAGTFELDQLLHHQHSFNYNFPTNVPRGIGGGGTTAFFDPNNSPTVLSNNTNVTGSYENRMVNAAVNWIMKY